MLGLGLREVPQRLIPASKTSPNLSAGLRWLGDKYARRIIGAFRDLRRIKELTFGRPKVTIDHPEERALESRPAKNQGAHLREAEGDEYSLRSASLKTGTCEGSQYPKDIGDRERPRRRTSEPSSVEGMHVKCEYMRRSDLCTSHLVILP